MYVKEKYAFMYKHNSSDAVQLRHLRALKEMWA